MQQSRLGWIPLAAIALLLGSLAVAQEAEPRRPGGEERRARARRAERPPQPPERRITIETPGELPGGGHVALIQLKHARAPEAAHLLAPVVRCMLAGPVLVEHDDRTNTLVVTAPTEKGLDEIRSVVEALDQPGSEAAGQTTEYVRLAHTHPVEVVNTVDRLLVASRVRLSPDQRGRSVWIAGPAPEVRRIVEVVRQMDEHAGEVRASHETPDRSLRFYSVEHARSADLAETLGRIAAVTGRDVDVMDDAASNTIIIFASEADADAIEAVARRLDVPPRRHAPPEAPAPQPPRGGRTKEIDA